MCCRQAAEAHDPDRPLTQSWSFLAARFFDVLGVDNSGVQQLQNDLGRSGDAGLRPPPRTDGMDAAAGRGLLVSEIELGEHRLVLSGGQPRNTFATRTIVRTKFMTIMHLSTRRVLWIESVLSVMGTAPS